jgi:HSP20 family molecular chaperone IbpA
MNNTALVKQSSLDDIFFIPDIGDLKNNSMSRSMEIKQNTTFNITEDQYTYTISLVAPGLDNSDFEVCITDGILVVKFRQRNPYSTDRQGNSMSYPSVKFFRLSDDVNKDHFQATYNNDILKIRLQKKKR